METKDVLTEERLDRAERCAEAATPGPWKLHPGTEGVVYADHYDKHAIVDTYAGEQDHANAAFIAECDPTFVLALIAEWRVKKGESK